jgi:type I restriction enzyme S subunit
MILHKDYYPWITNFKDYVRIKDVFKIHQEVSENPEDEIILSLTQRGIIERDISKNEGQLPESYNKYNLIYPNDIVLNPMDLLSGWVDISSFKGLISPSYKTLRLIDEQNDNVKYYCYQLQRYYWDKILFKFGEGVSYDFRWGINNDILLNFPIKKISFQEQNKKVEEIEKIFNITSNNMKIYNEKIEVMKQYRKSFLVEQLSF